MKKFIYILLFASICALTVSSCTEEEVTPSTELDNGGVNGSSDKGGNG